jgi:hypothetical protein
MTQTLVVVALRRLRADLLEGRCWKGTLAEDILWLVAMR